MGYRVEFIEPLETACVFLRSQDPETSLLFQATGRAGTRGPGVTGSYPPRANGWQRNKRHRASAPPRPTP
jgi:hypothetical protein